MTETKGRRGESAHTRPYVAGNARARVTECNKLGDSRIAVRLGVALEISGDCRQIITLAYYQ